MMVKICGITNQADAELCVDAGATALGFNFYRPSPRFIEPAEAAAIAGAIPSSVTKVGIFVDQDAATIAQLTREAGLDVAQVYGDARPPGTRFWRACHAGSFSEELIEAAEAVLLDTPGGSMPGGTGQTFDWTLAHGLAPRLILAGGLDDTNVQAAIAAVQPWGVDACSRLESSPGRKDPQKVRNFIRAALNA